MRPATTADGMPTIHTDITRNKWNCRYDRCRSLSSSFTHVRSGAEVNVISVVSLRCNCCRSVSGHVWVRRKIRRCAMEQFANAYQPICYKKWLRPNRGADNAENQEKKRAKLITMGRFGAHKRTVYMHKVSMSGFCRVYR